MKAIGAMLAVILAMVLHAYVMVLYWQWFVLPLRESFVLSLPQAVAFIFFMAMIRSLMVEPNEKETPQDLLKRLIAHPLLVTGIGYIINLFM